VIRAIKEVCRLLSGTDAWQSNAPARQSTESVQRGKSHPVDSDPLSNAEFGPVMKLTVRPSA
jgi:hypothetical protein